LGLFHTMLMLLPAALSLKYYLLGFRRFVIIRIYSFI
jgi:hypothetical protein